MNSHNDLDCETIARIIIDRMNIYSYINESSYCINGLITLSRTLNDHSLD